MTNPKYKRVVLKLSGEALAGDSRLWNLSSCYQIGCFTSKGTC